VQGTTTQGPDVDLLADAWRQTTAHRSTATRFPCSAVRSHVNRTLRAHECSLAFGIG
jgi:hypothetical protein